MAESTEESSQIADGLGACCVMRDQARRSRGTKVAAVTLAGLMVALSVFGTLWARPTVVEDTVAHGPFPATIAPTPRAAGAERIRNALRAARQDAQDAVQWDTTAHVKATPFFALPREFYVPADAPRSRQ